MAPQNPGTTGLVEQARRVNQASSPEQRRQALDTLARMVQDSGAVRAVFTRLLSGDVQARRIALEILLRFQLPISDDIIALFETVLSDREVPSPLRVAAAAALVRSVSAESPRLPVLVRSLATGSSRSRALDRLRQLRERLRECPRALESVIEQLDARVLMRCPRCPTRLVRPEMVKHLWQEHRLMLDGPRVREPWRMIEDWLGQYARTGEESLLERSCELGEQLDPEGGLVRVHRLLLGVGHRDLEALNTLRTEAAQRHATLCPHCFAIVPLIEEPAPSPMTVALGRIASRGYSVEIDDSGAVSHLSILTPTGILFDGHAPDGDWTWKARLVVLSGSWVVLALVVAIWLPRSWFPPLVPVILLLLGAVIGYVAAVLHQRKLLPITTRAVDAAWSQLVPHLHTNGFSLDDAGFVRSLAQVSIAEGRPLVREQPLNRVAQLTQSALGEGRAKLDDLVGLRRLEVADAARSDRDPMVVLAQQISECFMLELPIDFAERLLAGWDEVAWWTAGNRARLAIMLAAAAFDAGWEVWDLHELGQHVPLLGQALRSDDLDHLASLRRLWIVRSDHEWQETGRATLVFDLARFPVLGAQYLESRPDLLLFQPMTDGEGENASSDPILVCRAGILYRGVLIADRNAEAKIKARALWQGGGFELTCGTLRLSFRQEPVFLAKRLQGWIHFLFHTFLPSVDGVLRQRSPERLIRVLHQKTVVCPECRCRFLGRRGERGEPSE